MAAPDTLDIRLARTHYRSGHYDQALVALDRLVERGGPDLAEVEELLVRTLGEVGEIDALRSAVPARAAPRTVAVAAGYLRRAGALDEAGSLLGDARARHPATPVLELEAALLARDRGQRQRARQLLAGLPVSSRPDTALAAAELLTAGRIAWLRSDLRLPGEAHEYQAALRHLKAAYARDPDLLEARLATAALYLEKYESKLARGELGEVLRRNPRHPDGLVLAARTDLEEGRYASAAEHAARALEVDPRHLGALELLAVVHLADEEPHAAAAVIERGLSLSPGNRRLRALRAALYRQLDDVTAADDEVQALLAGDPHDAEVYDIMGAALDRLRRYEEAAELYRRALEVDPRHAPSANALGLLEMRDGRETEAREWLQRGFELDRFNIRSHNMLGILDLLDSYERFETPHFVIKVSAADRSLLPLFASELEDIYQDETARFGFTPERRTTIEVFERRDLLSGRLVGLPGIDFVPAACFGSVIAMESPRNWDGRKNWCRVLRHEFGHVLALERTRKRVPHWFTEGLSVVLEEGVEPQAWQRMARTAIAQDDVLPFTGLNHGFTRSRNLLERNLAYYKSSFAVEHLIRSHGWDTMLRCLDDYAAGRSTDAWIPLRLGMSAGEFARQIDAQFLAHVEALPLAEPAPRGALLASVRAADAQPDDAGARARMAELWMERGELETAVSEALLVVEDHPEHVAARFVLGHALLEQGEAAAAAEYLEPLLGVDSLMAQQPTGYLLVRDLGLVYAELGDDALASAFLEQAIARYPSEAETYRKLAEVHERTGRLDAALAVLDTLTASHPREADAMLHMAEVARQAGRPALEVRALRRALGVRPYETSIARQLVDAATRSGDTAEAVTALETVCLLDRDDLAAHERLVALCLEHGPVSTARRYAPRLLELDPQNAAGRRALERP